MAKKKKEKQGRGRPSKYDPIYCRKILEYFEIDPQNFKDITITHKDGSSVDKTEEEAAPLPTIRKFANSIGVDHTTLLEWCKKYPEFSTAYNKAREAQKEFIIENALRDNYSGYFAGLLMKNMFGWRDKTDVEHSGEVKVTHMGKVKLGKKVQELKIG